MINEAIDLARQKKIPFRTNRGQVIDHTILVKNEDGSNYDFSGHTAEMYVYNSFSKTSTPEYTVTVTLSSGEMHFAHPAINILREELVYQLWITNSDPYRQVWLNGPFLILNREWDHEDGEDTITISPSGDEIALTVETGVSTVKSVEYTFTSAQILNLHTTPVQYIAPIGITKYPVPISCEYIYTFGGTAYTRNSSASMIHTYNAVTSAGITSIGNILTQSFNAISRAVVAGAAPVDVNQSLMLNQGMYLSLNAGSFTLGNGTLKIKVLYHIVTV